MKKYRSKQKNNKKQKKNNKNNKNYKSSLKIGKYHKWQPER